MAYFSYQALDPISGRTMAGKLEAQNARQAKEKIRDLGQVPTQLDEEMSEQSNILHELPVIGDLLKPSIGLKDLNILTQQLAVLLDAGIPLIEALFLLEQQTYSKRAKEVLQRVRSDVIAGDSFSVALRRFPNEFPKLYTQMINAGEVSGEMDKICFRLAALYEQYMILQKKVIASMLYPGITLLIIGGVVLIILIFVVPMFKDLFSSKGAELPMPTQMLLAMSQFVQSFWWVILIALTGLAFWFNIWRKSSGKKTADRALLRIPIIGNVFRKIYVSRFVRTLATVLSAGVSLTEGLQTSADTIDNVVMREGFDKARDSLIAGGSVSRPLEQTGLFPLMVTKMIGIGEETGDMEGMLNKAADFLDLEVDGAINTMTTLIEPIMIVLLGGILMFVALSLYLPLFDLGSVMSN